MKFKVLVVSILFICSLLTGIGFAQNKVVVIPLVDEIKCKCTGTISSGGRWCDQGNGTVMDMSTCLVWLKKTDWGGLKAWRNSSSYDDANTRAGQLSAGVLGANLTDESTHGDWRLPTKNELLSIRQGNEPVTWMFDELLDRYPRLNNKKLVAEAVRALYDSNLEALS